jgi:hypothetical protein
MNKRKIILTPLIVELFLLAPVAFAADIHWNGFMSVVAGTTMDKGKSYASTRDDGSGAIINYTDDVSFSPESMMGLQGQINVSDQLRFTMQLVAKGNTEYNLKADWAYATYSVNDHVAINAGRFRLPLFYYSDFLDVGYAYDWIRPPAEVYITPASINGASFNYSNIFGNFEVSSQAWYGSMTEDPAAPNVSRREFTQNQGINLMVTYDWLKVRAVANTTNEVSTLTSGEEVAHDIIFRGLAVIADYDNVKWRSEYTTLFVEKTIEMKNWYASLGYDFGGVTPHYTHTINDVTTFKAKTAIDTFGIAWSFTPGAILKTEYLVSKPDGGDSTKVASAAIDIVF